MHRRRVVHDGFRQNHYHCCGLRFLGYIQAVKHLLRRHQAPSREAADAVISRLQDPGAVPTCAACLGPYVAQRQRCRERVRALPEEADQAPHDPLLGEQALAWAILCRAVRDAQGRCTGLSKGEAPARLQADAMQFLQEDNPIFSLLCDVLDKTPETVRRRLQGPCEVQA